MSDYEYANYTAGNVITYEYANPAGKIEFSYCYGDSPGVTVDCARR